MTASGQRATWTNLQRQLTDEERMILALIRRHPGHRMHDVIADLKAEGFHGSPRQTQNRLRYLTLRGMLKRERGEQYAGSFNPQGRPPYGYRLTALGERFAPL